MNPSLIKHLKEIQRIVRLRRAELGKAWNGKEDDRERSFLAIEFETAIKRLEDRLFYEEVE